MKNATVETLIGAIVIVVAAAFFLFAYQTSGKGRATNGYHLVAEFDNAEGINIEYLYGTIDRGSKRALIVLGVSDVEAAARVTH